MTKESQKLFLAVCFSTGVALAGTSTEAFERRLHASACTAITGVTNFVYLANQSTTNSLILECPIPTDWDISKFSLKQINLHGTDLSDNYGLVVQACIEYWNAASGQCGNGIKSSGAGIGTVGLTVPLTSSRFRSDEGDFAYLVVSLPPKDDKGASSVKGYWMTN